MPSENAVAETRREPLDLSLYSSIHFERRTVRHMTVGPGNVPSLRRSCLIEECGLGDEHERPLRRLAICHLAFRRRYFVERSAQMDRARHGALFRFPGNGRGQRVIDFVNSWTISELRQSASVGNGHAV